MTKKPATERTHYSAHRLGQLQIPYEVFELLSIEGLPTWSAPNVYFGPVGTPESELPSIHVGTDQYIGIGEDRDDNLIVLRSLHWDVWVLSSQQPPVFLAASVRELLLSFETFQACVNSAVDVDSKAFVENRIPSSHLEPFVLWAYSVDPRLIQPGSFWAKVLAWLGMPNRSIERTVKRLRLLPADRVER